MAERESAGRRLLGAMELERPLQVVGAINAYCALLAERVGFRALYLSGAGVANASFGLPDLGMTTLHGVLEDARRITGVTELPLLVDVDTGFGGTLMVGRTIREAIRAGVAGVHLEDQIQEKRCGHRPRKTIVAAEEMIDRVAAAVDARGGSELVVMARTDAVAVEGLDSAIERSIRYVEAGADAIFAEAVTDLEQLRRFVDAVGVPVLANLTEFGRTPLYTLDELASAGARLALYPLSAFRAMNAAALRVFQSLRTEGTQKDVLDLMQTREELYATLDYHAYERALDERTGRGEDDER